MDQLAVARHALETEIEHLNAEVARLQAVLKQLGGSLSSVVPAISTSSPKMRGRPKIQKDAPTTTAAKPAAGGRISNVLKVIAEAGRGGIKALSLASQLKKAGIERPSKEELLQTGKVKSSGTGGGTTYLIIG